MKKINIVLQIIIIFYFQITNIQSQDKLVFISNLFRHGARGPVHPNLNTDSKFNTFYKDQLTPTGQRQHYVLGQTLRDRYIIGDKYGLGLSEKYNNTEIYVQSTEFNRTINSALCQLNGLYPPGTGPFLPKNVEGYMSMPPYKGAEPPSIGLQALSYNFQNIPVHNVPMVKDYLLTPNFPTFCPGMLQITEKFFKTKYFLERLEEATIRYQSILDDFTEVLELPQPLTFMESEAIWDTLIADKFNGQPCKNWDKITDEMWEGIRQLDSLYWFLVFGGDPDNVKIGASSVLESWIQYSDIKLKNEESNKDTENLKNLKYVMYSAHDLNVQNAIISLQFSDYQCVWDYYTTGKTDALNCNSRPYFAASMIYELYVSDDTQPYVKILLDGEYQYLCGVKDIQCDYQDFKEKIYNYIYVDGNPEKGLQKTELCKLQPEDEKLETNDKLYTKYQKDINKFMNQYKTYRQNVQQQEQFEQQLIQQQYANMKNFGLSLLILLVIILI